MVAALAPQLAAGPAPKKPNQAPFVVLWSPDAGDQFTAPGSIVLAAGANDPDGSVKSVKYYADSIFVGSATRAPYTVWWENVQQGTHVLKAVATDNAGAEGTSASITITVKPNPPPTVHLDSPSGGDSFIDPEFIMIAADADDSDGGSIKSVTFFADAAPIGTVKRAPYFMKWRDVPVGPHVLTAVATDNGGATGTSAPINITVKQNAAPIVSLTSPSASDSFTEPAKIVMTAEASDSDGSIKVVRFYAGDRHIGSSHEPPYEATFRHVDAGTYVLTAVAIDDRGARTTSAPVPVTVKPNTPPAVSISSPADGSRFKPPATVEITADASDSDGQIKFVRFFVNGVPFRTDVHAPYTAKLRHLPKGIYDLTAVATDNGGSSTESKPVRVTISDDDPPTVEITSPADAAVFTRPADITITAKAADDSALHDVTFYADDTPLVTRFPDPSVFDRPETFTFVWSGASVGPHTLKAVATDDAGQQTTSTAISITVKAGTTENPPLVQPNNLVYEGAFRLPPGRNPGPNATDWELANGLATFNFGGWAMAFNPANNSLFLTGNNQGSMVAEINIPTPLVSADLGTLNVATFVQPFSDPTEAKIDDINPGSTNAKKIGGMLPYQGKLYVTGYDYYDGLETQIVSHFVANPDLSVLGDVQGAYELNAPGCVRNDPATLPNCLGAGFFDGYFGLVPLEWQAALGGPVINGNCCLGVISRTSYGPALFTMDPAQLGVITPLPAKPLLYYPSEHPLIEPGLVPCLDQAACSPVVDGWSLNSTLFNGTSEVKGVAFPSGWRSVLFFGRHGGLGAAPGVPGLGQFCYGPGTEDPLLAGQPFVEIVSDVAVPTGDNYCYDPEDNSKGVHGYPYHHYVWAYDANDLAAVAGGQKQPWDVKPYAVWELNGLPFPTKGATRASMAFDPQTGRIFIAQYQADAVDDNTTLSVIHVFKVQ